MKKLLSFFSVLFFALAVLCSCEDEDDEFVSQFKSEDVKGCYIVNYGNYGKGGCSISKYDYDKDEMTNNYFKQQNIGIEMSPNIQHISKHNDRLFLMGNVPDAVIEVNPLFEQSYNGIAMDKPRFSVAEGNYLYVSCCGSLDWANGVPDSYIAKYDLSKNEVVDTISLPGGPEGLAISNGKLYAALNYKDSVAVLNLENRTLSYIETPAVTSYFIKDKDDNLYVSLVSTYTSPSQSAGLGYINTTTDELTETYPLSGISSDYGAMMVPNSDFSKIYVVKSAWVKVGADWILSGAVSRFDVASKTFEAEDFATNISGLKGLSVNPVNDDVYLFAGETVTGTGLMKIYKKDGTFVKEHAVGASPTMALFID